MVKNYIIANVLCNKKNFVRHKMKKSKSKTHKLGTYEIDKISLSFLTIKDVLEDGIYTFSYFHKYSVTTCNN